MSFLYLYKTHNLALINKRINIITLYYIIIIKYGLTDQLYNCELYNIIIVSLKILRHYSEGRVRRERRLDDLHSYFNSIRYGNYVIDIWKA